ncbi:MAG: hypothetical protein AVDCRST_MAG87-345, partial [uncultured Thermomicrobiales bacterium]
GLFAPPAWLPARAIHWPPRRADRAPPRWPGLYPGRPPRLRRPACAPCLAAKCASPAPRLPVLPARSCARLDRAGDVVAAQAAAGACPVRRANHRPQPPLHRCRTLSRLPLPRKVPRPSIPAVQPRSGRARDRPRRADPAEQHGPLLVRRLAAPARLPPSPHRSCRAGRAHHPGLLSGGIRPPCASTGRPRL